MTTQASHPARQPVLRDVHSEETMPIARVDNCCSPVSGGGEQSDPVALEIDNAVMTQAHWAILRFMREYRNKHQAPADTRAIVGFLADDLGYGDQAQQKLFELFPDIHAIHRCKLARGGAG